MGITDGQAVSAAITNPAFLDANADDTATGKISFANTDGPSGPTVTNIQRETNSLDSFTGRAAGSVYNALPSWTNNDVGLSTDNLKTRADNLTATFNSVSGHTHDGSAGEGGPIAGSSLTSVPLRGYVNQGTDLTGVTGTSTNVSTELAGKSDSSGPTDTGVVVTAPQNKVILRQASGANEDDSFIDGSGNVVYGRLTFSTPTWTLSYYVDISGTETAYSFSSSDVRWYYQELYNPMVNPPVYSEFAAIPSDNATADVLTATTSIQGKTQLASAVAQSVGASNTAGTANATVANADHAHQGVHGIQEFVEAVNIYGDIILKGTTSVTVARTGQTFEFSSTGGGGGGGSFVWQLGDSNTPAEAVVSGVPVFDFAYTDEQEVWAFIRVPDSYVAGVQILIEGLALASSATSGNVFMKTVTYLVEPGSSVLGSLTNSHTSTNSEITVSGVANTVTDVGDLQLTDGSGLINAVAVAPGDLLSIKLFRDSSAETSSATQDARILRYSGSPKFTV